MLVCWCDSVRFLAPGVSGKECEGGLGAGAELQWLVAVGLGLVFFCGVVLKVSAGKLGNCRLPICLIRVQYEILMLFSPIESPPPPKKTIFYAYI